MWTSCSSSSSATTSTSSNSSSSPSPCAAALRLPRTMEDVWKDITLGSSDLSPHPSTGGVILQDFFNKDPPPSSSPPPPTPPTMLALNSAPDHFGRLLFPPHHHLQPIPVAFDAVVPDSIPGAGKKRLPEVDKNSGDRRHKRMIKNRESAARSRARKQAYTNELELEIAHLLEENAKLRKNQEQSLKEAAAAENQKRKSLPRSSSF